MQGKNAKGCLNLIKKFFVETTLLADLQIKFLLKIDMEL